MVIVILTWGILERFKLVVYVKEIVQQMTAGYNGGGNDEEYAISKIQNTLKNTLKSHNLYTKTTIHSR